MLVFGSGTRGNPAISTWGLGCVCLGTSLASPRHSWLEFAVCLLGFEFRGNPAIPGWGRGCVCLGTGCGFAPPILAGVCSACVLVPVSPARCHSWLGCGGVCPLARSPPVPRHSPVFRSRPPWSPLLLPPSFGFLSFFVCCGGVRVAGCQPLLRRGCAPACPGCHFLQPFSGCVVVVGHFF